MISIKELTKSFNTSTGKHLILDGVNFNLPDDSFTTLFGPNGCGKTTLLNILAGLDTDYQGTIEGMPTLRHQIGYVFQDYRRSLLPWYSVKENILFPLALQRVPLAEKEKRLRDLLAATTIHLDLNQRVHSLSGGQAQAVCILRALIIHPALLILDEPFAALDYERTLALRSLVSDIAKRLKLKVLFISHDLEEAITLGDQVVFMSRNPSKVVEVLKVDLPYPRTLSLVTSLEFNQLRARGLEVFKSAIGYRGN